MGRLYLDKEFTNGSYNLVDILEIALLAEETGNVYHSYVKINYSVPKQVWLLTGIKNRLTVRRLGGQGGMHMQLKCGLPLNVSQWQNTTTST